VADEFDIAYFQAKALDHGCFSPLSIQKTRNAPGALYSVAGTDSKALGWDKPRS
jgi:hypothetical protein